MTTTTPAVQNDKPSLAQLIKQMQPEIARALPRHLNPDRMARIATTCLRQTPALARCTPESFLGALLTASSSGWSRGRPETPTSSPTATSAPSSPATAA